MPGQRDEDFRPTSGRLLGALGVLAVVLALGVVALDPDLAVAIWAWPAGLLAVTVLWAAMLRPRVWVGEGFLSLRSMYATVHVPLAAVEVVAVRQVLVVTAGGRRFTCPAIGHPRRALVRQDRGGPGRGGLPMGSFLGQGTGYSGGPEAPAAPWALGVDYADFVESRLVELTSRARLEARVRPGSAEQAELAAGVRRERARPEIALTALGAVATLVALLLT